MDAHEKNRSCERTEEVLDNYRRRAVRAERRLAEMSAATRCVNCEKSTR